jgi:copper(I)-binding protein
MTRVLAAVALVLTGAAAAPGAQAPNVVTREAVVTATVDRIEKGSRLVTVHGDQNDILTVYVDPSVSAFDDLHVGDMVTMSYVESAVVELKPDATPADVHDTTAAARKAGGTDVIEQQTAVVTIESIDPQLQSVTYRNAAGLKVMRPVNDPRLLKGLHAGDRVRVTLTRERAIRIERKR